MVCWRDVWKKPGDFLGVVEGEEDFIDDTVWAGGAGDEAEVLGGWTGGKEGVFVEGSEGRWVGSFCFWLLDIDVSVLLAGSDIPPIKVGTQFTVGPSVCL